MEILPDTWYPAVELLDGPPLELLDGSSLHGGAARFLGSRIHALTGTIVERIAAPDGQWRSRRMRYLQVTLEGADAALVDALPPSIGISPSLLSQQLLYLKECTYAYDLALELGGRRYLAAGAVCVQLVLLDRDAPPPDLVRKSRNVDQAYRSGLLDELTRSRADFRLDIKPLTRRLTALLDSDYLPDDAYRVDVLFAQWYAQPEEDPARFPLGDAEVTRSPFGECRLQFVPTRSRRGMRVADLFERHEGGTHG